MSEKSGSYAATAGVMLWEFTKRVREVRPASIVMMSFTRNGDAVIDWSEIVSDPQYRWGIVCSQAMVEFAGAENIWLAWQNQVQKKYFAA
jgi:hypothetical protein